MTTSRFCAPALVAAALGCASGRGEPVASAPPPGEPPSRRAPASSEADDGTCVRRLADPPRTVVERPCGAPVAVLTDGAVTVLLAGASRRFDEETAAHPVVTTDWVRRLPAPFSGAFDAEVRRFVQGALDGEADAPDVLAIALEYVAGAPPRSDERGLQVAGDADYGPETAPGVRAEGADFNDYLGVAWSYPDGSVDRPEPAQLRSLDCSGYVRMVWGFRAGLPLAAPGASGAGAIPRRAVQMAAGPFGVVIVPDTGAPAAELGRLQAGDLVFFDADPGDGPAIDHVGLFLGRDAGGHPRFVSSRKGANGPTLGDLRGASRLDGPGLYARAFRSARRL